MKQLILKYCPPSKDAAKNKRDFSARACSDERTWRCYNKYST